MTNEESKGTKLAEVASHLLEACLAMMDVQSARRHPLGAPDEGIAYPAAEAASLARMAVKEAMEAGVPRLDPPKAGKTIFVERMDSTLVRVFEIAPFRGEFHFGGPSREAFLEHDFFHSESQEGLKEFIQQKAYYRPEKAYLVLGKDFAFTINYENEFRGC